MILYHGSGEKVEYPAVRKTGYTKDFSWGFYCTKNKKQAERWSLKRETPVLNVYEYEPHDDLKIFTFENICEAWLDFIADCRNGKIHDYDIVEGPMADDQVWDYVQDYLKGNINKQQFMILASFRHPTHQISFHTLKALDCLTFKEAIAL